MKRTILVKRMLLTLVGIAAVASFGLGTVLAQSDPSATSQPAIGEPASADTQSASPTTDSQAAPAPTQDPSTGAAPATQEQDAALPKTASSLPLVAVVGALLLIAGLVYRFYRAGSARSRV